MARSEAAALLRRAGLPVVYCKWPDGSAPQFPCIRYSYIGDASFRADNSRYRKVDRWSAILVSEWKDDSSEEAVEAALDAAGVPFSKSGDWYESDEGLNHVEYEFELPH